jgi:putative DNA methylase
VNVISPKKLIEVALPLDAINAAAAREKSIRHGHPSTLHLWWARRPLAAARAVIFAQLVHDPEDLWRCQNPGVEPNQQVRGHWTRARARLFAIIEDLVKWENTTNETVLEKARAEIRKSWRETCELNKNHPDAATLFNPEKMPGLHDPFAGGGAIPLEAQRLGLEAFASDLNPVAVLINKAMIEIPPKFSGMKPVSRRAAETQRGNDLFESSLRDSAAPRENWPGASGLAEDVRFYGQWMRDEAFKRIGHLYPPIEITPEMVQERPDLKPYEGEKLTVIAWLWARTVKSPNPAFSHIDVPLASTFILSSKEGKEAYVQPVIDKNGYRFTVKVGKPPAEAKAGTKLSRGANFGCLMSKVAIEPAYIKAEAMAGRMGQKLMAIVAEGTHGRVYLTPTAEHEATAKAADPGNAAEAIHVPIANDPRALWCLLYGLNHFDHLFTPRQLVALTTFSDLVGEARERIRRDALATLGPRASRPPVETATSPEPVSRPPVESSAAETAASPELASLGPRASRPPVETAASPEPASRPLQPVHSRGYLPHWEAGETPQSITFRTADSLPKSVLEQWQTELARLPVEQQTRERRKRIEEALDRGRGACVLARAELATIVEEALRHFDGSRYRLHAWVIMPNHVHVLITPLSGHSLSEILHTWKSYTAKLINKQLGQTGQFWQEEYFDRMIRDDQHFDAALEYIHNNPVKAGLCANAGDWPFSSAHGEGEERAGRPRSQASDDDTPLDAGGTGARAYAEAVSVYLAFNISKMSDLSNALVTWKLDRGCPVHLFARQAIPMVWDYPEANVFSESSGSWDSVFWHLMTSTGQVCMPCVGQGHLADQGDAKTTTFSRGRFISTDPPYYDNIGYADLSDFFYVWLRRSLRSVFPNLLATIAVPKAEELVATPYRHGTKEKAEKFFLDGMTQAMRNLALQAHPAAPITIYYAFKQSETAKEGTNSTGWETFLDAVLKSGLAITGTWPIRTEMAARQIAMGTNALASSIILVCRPRAKDAGTIDRRKFQRLLNEALPLALDAMTRPGTADVPSASASEKSGQDARVPKKSGQDASVPSPVAPVDLSQAIIGPGMAIFSRYEAVLEANGTPMTVKTALQLINRFLAEDDFDADTQFCLHWFEQHGWDAGKFGEADTLARAKGTSVDGVRQAGVIQSGGGHVRLFRWRELDPAWDPAKDPRIPVWQALHQMILSYQTNGDSGAGRIYGHPKCAAQTEAARQLAYRLYTLCERKGWAEDARAYNELVAGWSGIESAAAKEPQPKHGTLFDNAGETS